MVDLYDAKLTVQRPTDERLGRWSVEGRPKTQQQPSATRPRHLAFYHDNHLYSGRGWLIQVTSAGYHTYIGTGILRRHK